MANREITLDIINSLRAAAPDYEGFVLRVDHDSRSDIANEMMNEILNGTDFSKEALRSGLIIPVARKFIGAA